MTSSLSQSSGFSSSPGEPSVFVSAAEWVQGALLGSFATAVAVLAVAAVGLLMLTGRLNIRRGATVILGCFILFGAANIASGFRGVAASIPREPHRPIVVESATAIDPRLVAADAPPAWSDPYAGASVRR